ncbi:hypothetical protein LWI28_016541 [Acer negundo]|uniref:Uncharacterized protein n=1 Tax=Acer negundo TaxID=4023 RepID=A0AAD5III7_ACENE|nr:hypothetical protein LWI28_016541 [Acer negundo]
MMKEDFAKRIQLMKDDIEQRDKALSFMKYKELDYIEKLDIVEQSLKVLTNESIKPTAEIVLDKHQGGSSVPEIINKSDPIARRRKRNKKKRQSLPQRQNYHEASSSLYTLNRTRNRPDRRASSSFRFSSNLYL